MVNKDLRVTGLEEEELQKGGRQEVARGEERTCLRAKL